MNGGAQFKYVNALLFGVSCFFLCSSLGQASVSSVKPEPEEEETLEETLIQNNIMISGWFDYIADKIDLLLVGEKVTKRKNETSVKIENSSFMTSQDQLTNTTNLNVNLRLPNTEAYWLLKFATYDENEARRGVQNGYLRKSPRAQSNGAILGIFKKLGDARVSFQPRVDLGNPVKISHSLKFEHLADYVWFQVDPKLEFYATPELGTGIFISGNVNFPLSKSLWFSLIQNCDYVGRKSMYTITNGFNFSHRVSRNASLDYSFILQSPSQPNYHLEGYSLAISWGHVLYRRILDYRVTPHLDFAALRAFRGVPGVIFSVGLNF
ncbi:MAG: hypothetical protein K2X47_15290 [Bdellovibrionales bacterium]|nr:hypothetical protein [Bdellovibrionales bacterium]